MVFRKFATPKAQKSLVPRNKLIAMHCQCILSIFPASVHQFYVNILVFVNINPVLYTNDQFALKNVDLFFINNKFALADLRSIIAKPMPTMHCIGPIIIGHINKTNFCYSNYCLSNAWFGTCSNGNMVHKIIGKYIVGPMLLTKRSHDNNVWCR